MFHLLPKTYFSSGKKKSNEDSRNNKFANLLSGSWMILDDSSPTPMRKHRSEVIKMSHTTPTHPRARIEQATASSKREVRRLKATTTDTTRHWARRWREGKVTGSDEESSEPSYASMEVKDFVAGSERFYIQKATTKLDFPSVISTTYQVQSYHQTALVLGTAKRRTG